MGWRQIIITGRAKLDLKMNQLVVRKDTIRKININEIDCVVIETLQVSITTALLVELAKNKVKVIFCDETYSPYCEISSYYTRHNSSLIYKKQINWRDQDKLLVWTEIIKQKIKNQRDLLIYLNKQESSLLQLYLEEIQLGDKTNREGHAAKVYFNSLFGKDFTRDKASPVNAALNYGYSILLSSFNREIRVNGYLTQLGIFHDNQFNLYNLSSDIMEPFRPYIDKIVIKMDSQKFDKEEKIKLLTIFSEPIKIGNKYYELRNAISVYTKAVLKALDTGNINYLRSERCEL